MLRRIASFSQSRVFLITFVVTSLVSTQQTFANDVPNPNHVGEKSSYELDRSAERTSHYFKSGIVNAEVKRFVPDNADGPSYEISFFCDFNIVLVGRQSGTGFAMVPQDFFTFDWLKTLRQNGTWEHPKFRATHKGYADARTMSGRSYSQCDKILVDKIDQESNNAKFCLETMFLTAAEARALRENRQFDMDKARVTNLQVLAHVHETAPLGGAVKFDISGKVDGRSFKMGMDLK